MKSRLKALLGFVVLISVVFIWLFMATPDSFLEGYDQWLRRRYGRWAPTILSVVTILATAAVVFGGYLDIRRWLILPPLVIVFVLATVVAYDADQYLKRQNRTLRGK